MSIDSEAMGQIFYQAAIEVAQGRRLSPQSALVAACKHLQKGDPHQDVYGRMMWRECMRIVNVVFNGGSFVLRSEPYFPTNGGWGSKHWLNDKIKSELTIYLLFCYEYCVTEISGGRGRVQPIVTQCNDEECDGSQSDRCRFETTRCSECPMLGRPNFP